MNVNTIYEKNLSALSERYRTVADFLNTNSEVTYISEEESVFPGVSLIEDRKILYIEKDGIIYQLDSMYESDTTADVWFRGLNESWGLESKCCMYGLGNGKFVRAFLSRARKDCTIYVHEPSVKIFSFVLENFDISDILKDSRFKLILWPMHAGDRDYYFNNVLKYTDLSTYCVSIHINYSRLFPSDLQDYAVQMTNVRSLLLANQTVQERFGHNYNENSFNNFKYFKSSKSLADIKENIIADVPAVVVAAGPSLDNNIMELKNAVGKAFIIATDTALRPLAKAGICPDMAIVLDGKKDAKYLSEEESRKIPLICSIRAGKDFMNLHEGEKFFIYDYSEHLNKFCTDHSLEMVNIPTGASVANGAFSVAKYLGFKTIILIGQDLAYTGDRTHSNVTVRGEVHTAVEDLENVVWAEDIYGNRIRSSGEFKIYKEWFEQQIRENPQLKVYDATEGGVKIEGTEIITLKGVIERECSIIRTYKDVIADASAFMDDELQKEFQTSIDNIPVELNKLKNLAEDSYSKYAEMIKLAKSNNYASKEFRKLYDENTKISNKMDQFDVMEYVVNQLQEKTTEILDHVNELKEDEQAEIIAACELGKQHVENIIEAIKELKSYV